VGEPQKAGGGKGAHRGRVDHKSPFRVRLRDISEEGQELSIKLPSTDWGEALTALGGDPATAHVAARLYLLRLQDTVTVNGALEGEARVVCGRCLGPADMPIHVPLRIVLGPAELGAEDSIDDEVEYFTHDGEAIDFEEVLREALLIALPMTALCREDCRGLCVVCGADRNDTSFDCGHSQHVPDPRFAALKNLKV
jgi:uncharacterized protein